ncbi:MAG: hypothetical protein ACRCTE_02605 [Cellulosilyticaceae bacterium]
MWLYQRDLGYDSQMNTEALVEQIVNELYKKLQIQQNTLTDQRSAIILPLSSDMNQGKIQQYYHVLQSYDEAHMAEVVIVTELGIDLISQVALGMGQSPEAKIILEALLRGKPVYVLEQGITYRRYKSTAHRTLYGVYSEYENKIKQYGVRLIHDVVEVLADMRADYKKVQQVEAIEPEVTRSHESINLQSKKVILEADLTRAYIQGITEVLVRKNAIITPLAGDYIRGHHLVIKRM